uniref:CPSF30 n=1 Tax=Arundo donax TaxID=35708 RepID=A0A0A9D638_ARUDO
MLVPAIRTIRAKSHLVHVALLGVVVRVLVGAIGLAALAEVAEEAAHGHAGLVELVKEPARLALHAQPPQPVPAHRLPVATAAAASAVQAWPIPAPAATSAGVSR